MHKLTYKEGGEMSKPSYGVIALMAGVAAKAWDVVSEFEETGIGNLGCAVWTESVSMFQ